MALDRKAKAALRRSAPTDEMELDRAYSLGYEGGKFPSEWICNEECKRAFNAGEKDAREHRGDYYPSFT